MPKAHEWRWRPAPHCELPRFEPDCAASHFLRGGRSAAGNDVVTVLFLANSLVRQQFESIACRWPQQIRGGFVRHNGSKMGLHTTEKATPVEEVQLAPMRRADGSLVQCNGGDQQWVDRMFPAGSAPRQTFGGQTCDDNLALVEYEKLRLFFVFRPWEYGGWGDDGLARLLARLGVKPAEVDVVFTNNEQGKPPHRYALELLLAKHGEQPSDEEKPRGKSDVRSEKARTACGALRRMGFAPRRGGGPSAARCDDCWLEKMGFGGAVVDVTPVFEVLAAQQRKKLGFFYGAVHGAKGAKDFQHSCEPGMVDHAADLLLFMLATRSAPEGPHYGTSEDDLLRMLASGGEKVNRGFRIHAARNRTQRSGAR